MKGTELAASSNAVVGLAATSFAAGCVLVASGMTGTLAGLSADADAGAAPARTPAVWRAAWSERYPGCVSTVLWPADERPVAIVVRTAGGGIDRVDLTSVASMPAADAVGACR